MIRMMTPRVSIVFTNLNGGREPLDFLASVETLDYPREAVDVIMVDAGSTDGSDREATARFPFLNILRVPPTLGYPGAINRGIAESRGEFVFVGNDDLVIERESLRILVDRMTTDPSIGLASGRLFLKYPKRGEERFSYAHFRFHPWTGRITAVANLGVTAEVEWLQSCALLVRRTVFERIGSFDAAFFPMYFDDLDFCVRAQAADVRMIYEPTAVFRHGASQTMKRNLKGKTRAWYRNKLRYLIKHCSPLQLAAASLLMLGTAPALPLLRRFPRLGLEAQAGGTIAVWSAFRWNLKHIRQTLASRREGRHNRV